MFQEGAAKIRTPKVHSDPILETVLINTAGGLTGGDRMNWQVDLDEGTSVVLTSPTCEKIYRSIGDQAEIETRITVGAHAAISYLPQETLLFDRSALRRRLTVDLSPTSSGLFVEATIFGRQAMGESVRTASFLDRWRIKQDGRLLHAEDIRFEGDIQSLLACPTVTGGMVATATVLMVHPEVETLLDPVRAGLGEHGGATVWSVAGRDKLLVRLVAESGFALRNRLLPVLLRCNKKLLGSPNYGLPKVWTL